MHLKYPNPVPSQNRCWINVRFVVLQRFCLLPHVYTYKLDCFSCYLLLDLTLLIDSFFLSLHIFSLLWLTSTNIFKSLSCYKQNDKLLPCIYPCFFFPLFFTKLLGRRNYTIHIFIIYKQFSFNQNISNFTCLLKSQSLHCQTQFVLCGHATPNSEVINTIGSSLATYPKWGLNLCLLLTFSIPIFILPLLGSESANFIACLCSAHTVWRTPDIFIPCCFLSSCDVYFHI